MTTAGAGRHGAADGGASPSRPAVGQVALVTGATGGIGRALALGLADAGTAVGLLSRSGDRLEELRGEVESRSGRAVAVAADVRDRDEVAQAVAAVERDLGPIDLLVNNAGAIEREEVPIWESDPDEWWAVMETNVKGPFTLVQAVLPGMVARRRGRVVDLSSGLGARDSDVYSAYATSKAALFRVGGAVALAGAAHGIRAFEVSPGRVHTPMADGMAMHAGVPAEGWTPVEAVVDLVVAIAAGRLDPLSGRYLRAGADDLSTLAATAERIVAEDGRVLRVRPWGEDDPLA